MPDSAAKFRLQDAVIDCTVLSLACLAAYWLVASVLSGLHSESRAASAIGGLWTVLATIFVLRFSYAESEKAALTRLAATLVSFALCLIYLLFLPFHSWGLALLIGLSALAAMLLRRPGDVITAAITTAVVLVSAEISPQHAWRQPVLRLVDTVIGVILGVAAARLLAWMTARARRT